MIRGGSSYAKMFGIYAADDTMVDADSTPTARAYKNGVYDSSFTLTVASASETGLYKITGTVPTSYTPEDKVDIWITATIGGVSYRAAIDFFVVEEAVPPQVFVEAIARGRTSTMLRFQAAALGGGVFKTLVYNSADIAIRVNTTVTGTPVNITTPGTYVDPGSKYNIGIKYTDSGNSPGQFELQLSDLLTADTGPDVTIYITAAGMCPIQIVLLLDPVSAVDTDRARLANAVNTATAAALATLQTSVDNLNNRSALATIVGPSVLEVPESGTSVYRYVMLTTDIDGHLVDLVSSPTITVANATGTDRSSNLSSVTHSATGQYTFTYTVTAGDPQESLLGKGAGTASSDSTARVAYWGASVVDVDTITLLNAINTNAAAAANQTTEAAIQTALTDQGLTSARAAKLDHLDADVTSRLAPATVGRTLLVAADGTVTTNNPASNVQITASVTEVSAP